MDKQTQQNLLNLVKRNYDEIAEDFDITRKKYLWPELIKLADIVKYGDKILDVGCGNGRLVEAFTGKKINYLGIDNSEKLIESARKNLDSRFRGNDKEDMASRNDIRFKVGDILELDKITECDFDYIFCIAVLHHLPEDELRLKALEQMKNKLKPGGKIILTVWNLWGQSKYRQLIFKYGLLKLIGKNKMDFGDILFGWKNNKGERISQRYYYAFTENKLNKLIKLVNFKVRSFYKDKYNYYLILEK